MNAPALTPQVKGRLAQQELAILDLIKAGQGDNWRATVSLDPAIALEAVRQADSEQRDFSNFVSVALREYCGQRSAPTPEAVEFVEKLHAALADRQAAPRILALLDATLRKTQRRAPAKEAA